MLVDVLGVEELVDVVSIVNVVDVLVVVTVVEILLVVIGKDVLIVDPLIVGLYLVVDCKFFVTVDLVTVVVLAVLVVKGLVSVAEIFHIVK